MSTMLRECSDSQDRLFWGRLDRLDHKYRSVHWLRSVMFACVDPCAAVVMQTQHAERSVGRCARFAFDLPSAAFDESPCNMLTAVRRGKTPRFRERVDARIDH
jgi:hypothetical protein